MQKLEATRKQHITLICLILISLVFSFPFAMSGKIFSVVLWLPIAMLALLFGITRGKALIKPMWFFFSLFVASYFIPVELVVVRDSPIRVSWLPCEIMGPRLRLGRPIATATNYVIKTGCGPIIGVSPSRVLEIHIP